jgi:hypothetical protein
MMGWDNKDNIDHIVESGQLIEKTYTYESDFQNYANAFRNKKDNTF